MKKTCKLILALMLALFVFVSCENKPEETIKTAKDYLAGKTIVAALPCNTADLGFEVDEDTPSTMYFSFPVAFDKDGVIYANGAKLENFAGTVDGMVYKTTFKEQLMLTPMMEDEDEEEISYISYAIDFKVLNENKVSISGSMTSGEDTVVFQEIEADISGTLPSWFTSGDWLFIPNEMQSDNFYYSFMIYNEKSAFEATTFGNLSIYELTKNTITSKNDVITWTYEETAHADDYEVSNNSTLNFSKLTDTAVKMIAESSYVATDGNFEDGYYTSFEATVTKIDRIPEWAKDIYVLRNKYYDTIPVSNEAIVRDLGFEDVIYFNREVNDDSIIITVVFDAYSDSYNAYKEVTIINRTASPDMFICNCYGYYIYENGYEKFDSDNYYYDKIFTPSDLILL